MEFKDALALATELGYAEADPTADIDGLDAGRKVLFSPALLLIPEWYLMMFISKESQKFLPRTSAMQRDGLCHQALGVARNTESGVEAYVCPIADSK